MPNDLPPIPAAAVKAFRKAFNDHPHPDIDAATVAGLSGPRGRWIWRLAWVASQIRAPKPTAEPATGDLADG